MRTLIINGKDIATLGATLLTVDYGYSKVTTYKDWMRGTKNPLFYEQDTTYTTASFKVIVEAANREELDAASSNLVALARLGKFQVSDSPFYIDGNLTTATDDTINSKAKEITLNIEGIKVQPDSRSFAPALNETITFTPLGNCEVSAKFRITMDQGYTTYVLTVNGKSYSVRNTTSASTLTIDGIKGEVNYNGANKIEDYVAWEFPTLIGGQENTITISGGRIQIDYNGRWM